MGISTLVVHIDHARTVSARLSAALVFAADFDAHLTGFYVKPSTPYAYAGTAVVDAQTYLKLQADIEAEAREAREAFERAAEAASATVQWRQVVANDRETELALVARTTDILFSGQYDRDDPRSPNSGICGELALTAGRPIVQIPHAMTKSKFGRRILIAWNGSREAARAVSDALPVLVRADDVTVLTVNTLSPSQACAESLIQYLAAHGIKASHRQEMGVDPGGTILAIAGDMDSDLIVAGAYGHSRAREFILGGVTNTLLAEANVPVMMSH
ncbi:MAG: universal stress protein [Gammaproteobacteria bacterium]|nr:universal stress protein [Gammaproteobacteria bacterium]